MHIFSQTDRLDSINVPGLTWALTAVALALSLGRYAIRWIMFKKFHLDDLTHLVAMVALVAFAICVDEYVRTSITALRAEDRGWYPAHAVVLRARKWQLALAACGWVSLWAVKLTFLLFYRLLFRVSKAFQKVWWTVMVFTLVTFWGPIAGTITSCGPASDMLKPSACTDYKQWTVNMLIYSSIFQVVTDVFVMAIPLWMIHRLQMRPIQKFGMGLIFSIALVTIALEILRTVKSIQILNDSQSAATPQYAHATLYLAVEVGLNAWISSIAIYRSLFDRSSKVRVWFRGKRKREHRCDKCGARADEGTVTGQSATMRTGTSKCPHTMQVAHVEHARHHRHHHGMA